MSAAGLPSLEEGIKSPHVPEEYEHANMELKREETSPVASNTTDHVSRSNDPMQWSWLQKHSILACVSLLGGLGTYAGLFIVPAYGLMSKQFHTSITRVSYQVGIYVLVLGAAPLFWNPFAQTHGRRPVYIASTAIALAGAIWASCARSYGTLAGARVVLAFGLSAVHALGGVTVADIFPREVRGQKMGWWTLMTTMGPFIGPIFGGYIVHGTSNWYWIFGHLAIVLGILLVYMIFFLPETLYFAGNAQETNANRLAIRIRPLKGAETPSWGTAFFRPLIMVKYPACWLPGLWFAWTFSWSVGIATILTVLYQRQYHQTAPSVYLVYFSPFIGAVLGELAGGPLSDVVVRTLARRNNGVRVPEMRLHALYPGLLCVVVGLIVFGVTLDAHKPLVVPLIPLAIFIFGMQASTTVVFTYPVDCYLPQGVDALALIGGLKNCVSFAIPFYIQPMVNNLGIRNTFITMSMVSLALFVVCIVPLMLKGEALREWSGKPSWNRLVVRPADTQGSGHTIIPGPARKEAELAGTSGHAADTV